MNKSMLAVATLIGAAGALLVPAVSRADDVADQRYLSALASVGITQQHSASTLIAMGHGVCQELDQGKAPTRIGSEIMSTASLAPGDLLAKPENAGLLVASAVAVYCPQYRALIR